METQIFICGYDKHESQTPKLHCTWFCLRQFIYLYFDLKAGLVLLISFYKGAC